MGWGWEASAEGSRFGIHIVGNERSATWKRIIPESHPSISSAWKFKHELMEMRKPNLGLLSEAGDTTCGNCSGTDMEGMSLGMGMAPLGTVDPETCRDNSWCVFITVAVYFMNDHQEGELPSSSPSAFLEKSVACSVLPSCSLSLKIIILRRK